MTPFICKRCNREGEKVFEKRICADCHRTEMRERWRAKHPPKASVNTNGWDASRANDFLRMPLRATP